MLQIIKEPDPILKEYSSPIYNFKEDREFLKNLSNEMIRLMHNKRGVGISAPQVAILEQMIVVDPSAGKSANSIRIMCNPHILSMSNEVEVEEEGCLSLPGVRVPVARSKLIKVEYKNLFGDECSVELVDFEARICQHEVDHLYGITLSSFIGKT